MIKLISFICKRPDMTLEEFESYWREVHGPLVRSHQEAIRVKRYVQTHPSNPELGRAMNEPRGSEYGQYDGVAELWWESAEDLLAAQSDERAQRAWKEIEEDEPNWVDLKNSYQYVGEEEVFISRPDWTPAPLED